MADNKRNDDGDVPEAKPGEAFAGELPCIDTSGFTEDGAEIDIIMAELARDSALNDRSLSSALEYVAELDEWAAQAASRSYGPRIKKRLSNIVNEAVVGIQARPGLSDHQTDELERIAARWKMEI